jgi:hypothetical protein
VITAADSQKNGVDRDRPDYSRPFKKNSKQTGANQTKLSTAHDDEQDRAVCQGFQGAALGQAECFQHEPAAADGQHPALRDEPADFLQGQVSRPILIFDVCID